MKRAHPERIPIWKSPRGTKSPIQDEPKEKQDKPRHILIKLTKTKCKERILKAAREKQMRAGP